MIQSVRRFLLDQMVLRPSRYPIEHAPQQRVMLRWQGRPLECFVQRNDDLNEPPDLLVLKFPGNAGRAERSTPFPMSMVENVRVAVWTWNPPGYGKSGGRAGLARMADAAIDFWNQAIEQDCGPQTTVWLCGNSLGSVAALHVAATMQPDASRSGIILRNPPPLLNVVKRIALNYPLGRFTDPIIQSLHDSMNAMTTVQRVQLPAVFLQSELDTLVPLDEQNRLVEGYSGPRQVVLLEGLEHNGIPTEFHEPMIRRSMDWLWTHSACKADESHA